MTSSNHKQIYGKLDRVISKLEKSKLYYIDKAQKECFKHNGQLWENTQEWKEYWLEVAEFNQNLIDDFESLKSEVSIIPICKYPKCGLTPIPYKSNTKQETL